MEEALNLSSDRILNEWMNIEGKIKGKMEVTRRRGRRHKKLLDDLENKEDTLI